MTFPHFETNANPHPGWASVLTPAGRGAVATILIHADLEELDRRAEQGQFTFFLARNRIRCGSQELNRILFGAWGNEELVACRVAEQDLEIHCHGGYAAIHRILHDLTRLGLEILPTGTRLPIEFGTCSQAEIETIHTTTLARTLKTAEFLWQQAEMAGPFWERVERSLAEPQPSPLSPRDLTTLENARHWTRFGLHLITPWNVVIGGMPNVGKSSLINALLGYTRAIVHDQPGTTRDVVSGETALAGWPVLLSDTAGQRETDAALEVAGMQLAMQKLKQADLQILLIDQSQPEAPPLRNLLSMFPEALIVFNKADLPAHPDWQQAAWAPVPLVISCKQETGLDELLQEIARRLVPEIPAAGTIYPINERQADLLNQAWDKWAYSTLPHTNQD
ncbi:MAG: GTPase [Planctomycetaceae bacterium]